MLARFTGVGIGNMDAKARVVEQILAVPTSSSQEQWGPGLAGSTQDMDNESDDQFSSDEDKSDSSGDEW